MQPSINHRAAAHSLTGLAIVISVLLMALPSLGVPRPLPAPQTQGPTTPQPLNELIVFLSPDTSIREIESRYGVIFKQTLKSDPHAHIFVTSNTTQAQTLSASMASDTAVRKVFQNQRTFKVKHAFVPNDPYFDIKSSGIWRGYGQWHLANEDSHIDVNITEAWSNDVTGAGVTIGIVDDGLETAHEDLAAAYVASNSWDFGDNDSDPNPVYSNDDHGTSVAGVTAARGGNSIGVVGAAPYASLAGLRIDYNYQTTAMFVDATLYHSSGSNTSIAVKNHSYGSSSPYAAAPLEWFALATSTATGTIHVFSAGNDRDAGYYGDPDSNKKEPQNSPDSITVAALGFDGAFSYYSCFGANIAATLPSSDEYAYDAIVTVDRTGTPGYNTSDPYETFPDPNYTSLFGGTSSAAPLMAGILALGKQAQPALNTRFAKHLLARTCVMVDPADSTPESDGGWRTNAAGFAFNQNYGFGLVDASAFVSVATQYVGVTTLQTETTPTVTVNTPIPDNSTNGLTQTFSITNTTPLEEMLVTVDISHTYDTDIEIYLTSPDGYRSRLAKQYGYAFTAGAIDWTFCTHAFWGCNPQGTWTLNVSDRATDDTGTWTSFSATARMGELISVAPTFQEVTISPTNAVLQWQSLPDRYYAVRYSTDLSAGFSTIASNLMATPPLNTYTDTVHSASQRFWQVIVE